TLSLQIPNFPFMVIWRRGRATSLDWFERKKKYVEKQKKRKEKFARKLRRNMTWGEKRLWAELKGSQLGCEFIPQKVILGWIADFYCPSKSVVLEIDGPYHDSHKDYDAHRDKIMIGSNLRVIRIPSNNVFTNCPQVVDSIKKFLGSQAE